MLRESPTRLKASSVAAKLHSLSIRLLREARKDDFRLGVTSARLSALSVLVFGGPTTLGRLAEIEQVSQPTMTRIAAALTRGGYAKRTVAPDDRRYALLEATAKGRRLLEDGRRNRESRLAALLATLSPKDLRTCNAAADLLAAALRPADDQTTQAHDVLLGRTRSS